VSEKENLFSSKPKQIAEATVNAALEIFGNLKKLNLAVIGDLSLNENISNNLKRLDLNTLDHFNQPILFYFDEKTGKIKDIEELTKKLFIYDILLVGFREGLKLVSDKLVKNILKKRKQKPIFYIDSGLPGNIEPSVRNINNCFLFDLNDLEQFYTFLNHATKKDVSFELDYFDDQKNKYLGPFFKKLELNNSQVLNFMHHLNLFLKKNNDTKINKILIKFFESFNK